MAAYSVTTLGWTNLEVSPLGLGCWAIGGPTQFHGSHFGWGQVDQGEAIRAIHLALDGGITFIDTADIYGTGQSERIVGQALTGRRDRVLVATKFGLTFDEFSGNMTGRDASPTYIKQACEASLRRLGTDYIDLYQFHIGGYDPADVDPVLETLDELVTEGKIRYYAWGTDRMLSFCDEHDLLAIVNGPLGKGLLTGKFNRGTRFAEGDLRQQRGWDVQEGSLAKGRPGGRAAARHPDERRSNRRAGGTRCSLGAQRALPPDSRVQDRCPGARKRRPSSTDRCSPSRCAPSPPSSPPR